MQQRTLAGYALMHGLTVDGMVVERVSGSTPLADRLQGAARLAALKAGDVLITAKPDPMFSSSRVALDVLAKLKDRNVSLHMI